MIWNLPYISTLGLRYLFLNMGKKISKNIDQGWLEFIGSQGLFSFLKLNSSLIQYFFKNNLKIYLIIFVGWVLVLMIIII